jgi:hypothetical protein
LLMRKDEAGSEISAVIVELRRNKMDLIFCDSELKGMYLMMGVKSA